MALTNKNKKFKQVRRNQTVQLQKSYASAFQGNNYLVRLLTGKYYNYLMVAYIAYIYTF